MAGKEPRLIYDTIVFSDSDDDYYYYENDKEEEEKDYGDCGLSLEKLKLGPKKKLLVLSMNGLLVHRTHRADKSSIPNGRIPDATYGNHFVFKRPFLEEFMRFCFERFEVGIWSSAIECNVDNVLDCAFGKFKDKLLFVWDQKQCTESGFKSLEKKEKPLFFKELKNVWAEINNKKHSFNPSDTLFIDDKPYKALLNPPNTGIFPDTYDADDVNDNALDPKGELAKYLEGVADAKDVQSYVNWHPFGQPPVTEEHPQWDFYSVVIRHIRGRRL